MPCHACPVDCGIDRSVRPGACGATDVIRISNVQLHHWEEPPISGTRGSGTIFFSHCNLHCRFCQNSEISQLGGGRETTTEELLTAILQLRDQGAHNINLVSPTQYTEQLIPVLEQAVPELGIPVVWNSNAYEKVETLRKLEGLVRVWLPDLKYRSDELARDCSAAPGYFGHAAAAVTEMARQAGPNRYADDGTLQSGLIVRHLVLPGHTDDSKAILDWIARNLGIDTTISLMAQYYPAWHAKELDGMNRRLTPREYETVRDHLLELGFDAGFTQDLTSATEDYTPDFG
jgi:putative pyruvate formate lyase activating enzyme